MTGTPELPELKSSFVQANVPSLWIEAGGEIVLHLMKL